MGASIEGWDNEELELLLYDSNMGSFTIYGETTMAYIPRIHKYAQSPGSIVWELTLKYPPEKPIKKLNIYAGGTFGSNSTWYYSESTETWTINFVNALCEETDLDTEERINFTMTIGKPQERQISPDPGSMRSFYLTLDSPNINLSTPVEFNDSDKGWISGYWQFESQLKENTNRFIVTLPSGKYQCYCMQATIQDGFAFRFYLKVKEVENGQTFWLNAYEYVRNEWKGTMVSSIYDEKSDSWILTLDKARMKHYDKDMNTIETIYISGIFTITRGP